MQHTPRAAITLPHAHIDGAYLWLAPAWSPLVQQFTVGDGEVRAGSARHRTGRDCPDVDARGIRQVQVVQPGVQLALGREQFLERRRRPVAVGSCG